jgi:hypothetical protein
MKQDASNNFLPADMRQETETHHHAKETAFSSQAADRSTQSETF